MNAKQTISKFLKILLVTGIYFSFFAVQLLYNFDLANSQKNNSGQFESKISKEGSKTVSFYQKSTLTYKANIRLNKRFEPNSLVVCNVPIIEICVIHYMPEKLGHYNEQYLISTIPLSSLLRGPPAFA